ncbi:hypothetical protein E3V33_02345 [Candidatus Marinimicrobia bacterium MT.SAG.4]|nr:hypothetical protein E3V33_02345 [Candidatus Marinimicrobia bacterium MT.SAG.4]
MKRNLILISVFLAVGSLLAQQPELRNIRYGTHEEYTRIVFEFSGRVQPVINDLTTEKIVELIFSAVNIASDVDDLTIDDGVVKKVEIKKIADGIIVSINIMASTSTLRKHYFEQPDRVVVDIYKSDERKLSNAERFLQEGIDYFGRKEYDDALLKFREALRIRPGYTDAYFYAGMIRKDRNQYDMAKFNFGKALTDEERWGDSHIYLADILLAERDTSAAIIELSRYVAVGKSEEKVIQAEARLSAISGFPSIESPAEKPSEVETIGFGKDRKLLYSLIGALLLIIGALSIYVIRNKQLHSVSDDDQDDDAGTTGSSNEHSEETETTDSVDTPKNEIQEIFEKENSNNERWLRTDKQAIAEVDRLMDKFGELEQNEKEIDAKISETTNQINGNKL